MAWSIDASIGKRLRSSVATLEMMGRDTRVMREALAPQAYRSFLADTLLLRDGDVGTAEAITARICDTLGTPCRAPDAIAQANPLEASETSIALSRHMGVDPIRLALAAFDAKGKANHGAISVDVEIKRSWGKMREKGRPDRLDVRIHLGGRATWRGSRLTVRSTALPEAMTIALPGRRLQDVVAHDWEGWSRITIVGAARSGDSLLIETDATSVIQDCLREAV